MPPTPKQLAEEAENTPEFQGVVNDLIRLEDAHQYRVSWLRYSASELLRRSGYYHDALADRSEREIWERLSAYTKPRKAHFSILLLLDGCVFPRKEFELFDCTVVRHSAAEIGELGPPREIAESFFPEETLDQDWYSQQWFLRGSGSSDSRPGTLRWVLDSIEWDIPLHDYWPHLLALGLYHFSCFDIPIVLRSEAKWSLHRLRFSPPRVDPAGGGYEGYEGYDEDGEPIPMPGPTAGYRVPDDRWIQLEAFLRFFESAFVHTKDWNSIRIAARRYLRATFLSVRYHADDREDILLQYIFALESLLLAGDREAITDKIAARAALICGRDDDERKEIYDYVRRAYSFRSDVVHGKEGKKGIDRTRLRDICRQVIVVILSVARECDNEKALARVVKELAISRAIQDTVAKHRDDVFPLMIEIPWAEIYEENPTMPR